ncbi:MAG: gliding motility protein GldB [Prevotella sp.]|nr:gliding motility protein GldB [Prevotella sp.]
MACEFKLKPNEEEEQSARIEVQRYDRLESRYLTTGDFSALQQMNTDYPMETRMLIEDMMKLGEVSDPEINSKFLRFFQDTLLQTIIMDAEAEFANMKDINRDLDKAVAQLEKLLPGIKIPVFYTQIGALNQSIVVGDQMVGISLDKYLGSDYQPYQCYYSEDQRKSMARQFIVPDAISFYLLSLYPLQNYEETTQEERDMHMGRIMWVTNKALGRQFFKTPFTAKVEQYMRQHPKTSIKSLLTD